MANLITGSRELKKKGLIKIDNFKSNPKKLNYAYILTPKVSKEKTSLTINFYEKKMQEYEELKSEIDKKMINYNSILITGGTGSFGRAFVKHLISSKKKFKRIVIF